MPQKRNTRKVNTTKQTKRKKKKNGISINGIIKFILLVAIAVFVLLADKGYCGPFGMVVRNTILSLFGTIGHSFYILLLAMAISFLINEGNGTKSILLMLLYISIISFISAYVNNIEYTNEDVWKVIEKAQEIIDSQISTGNENFSAGIISTVINYYLFQLVNRAGILITHGFFVVLFFLLSFGIEGIEIIKKIVVSIFMFIPRLIQNKKEIRRDDIRINLENERKLNELIQRKERERKEREQFSGNITTEELIEMGIDVRYDNKDNNNNNDLNDEPNNKEEDDINKRLIQMDDDLKRIKILDSSELKYDTERINVDVEKIKSRFFRLNDLDNNKNLNDIDKKHNLLNQMKEKSINEIKQGQKELNADDFFYDKTKKEPTEPIVENIIDNNTERQNNNNVNPKISFDINDELSNNYEKNFDMNGKVFMNSTYQSREQVAQKNDSFNNSINNNNESINDDNYDDSYDNRDELLEQENNESEEIAEVENEDIPDVNEEESLSVDNDYNDKLDEATETEEAKVIKEHVKRTRSRRAPRKYRTPPLYLLKKSEKQNSVDKEYLKETAQTLQSTLAQFGVGAKVTKVTVGPTVTRYELLPSQGVRVKKFIELQDDIKLAMAATDIRIEAPIPGKSAVGIEVPNRVIKPVLLGDLITTSDFRNAESKLSACIGRDIAGNNIICDIATLPHLLVAGSTGSGKSVCINSIIMSLIYKASPEDVKLILVDPKVVELQIYNDIPHLLVPVVTDPKRAAAALNWAVSEMMRRYNLIVQEKLRDIDAYNKTVDEYNRQLLEEEQEKDNETEPKEPKEKLPKIVIIIDEFSDLMMVASKEVENAIMRIAQLARACGIYLIIATQRPSVNVISGSIKANVPGRIAFAVSSGIDSKTILDQYGAEKLIGKGDMLYSPTGTPKPIRVQGCLVTDEEIKRVVKFVKDPNVTFDEEIDKTITETSNFDNEESKDRDQSGLDEYFIEAGKLIIQSKIASSGFLQRKLQIGFNRASRILDQLADNGVVTEQDGKKPREILMEMDEFLNTFDN